MMRLTAVALAVLSVVPVWASPAGGPARMNLISTQRLAELLDAWRAVGVAPSVLPEALEAVAQAKPAAVFPIPADQIGHALLDSDGTRLIYLRDGTARLREVESVAERHVGWAQSVALSGDGRTALLGDGRSFDAVEVETGRRRHLGWGVSGVLSDDGRTALIGDGRAYQVVDVPTGMSRQLAAGRGVELSADGKVALLSGPNNGPWSVCRMADLSCRHLAWGRSARLSRDGRTALVSDAQSVYAYDTTSSRGGHLAWGELMSLSANGLRAAVRSNGWVQVYDVAASLSK
jgi:hypothetical protein